MIGAFINRHSREHRSAIPTCDNSEDYPHAENDIDYELEDG